MSGGIGLCMDTVRLKRLCLCSTTNAQRIKYGKAQCGILAFEFENTFLKHFPRAARREITEDIELPYY